MNFDDLIDKLIKARDKLKSEASGEAVSEDAPAASGGAAAVPAVSGGNTNVRVFFEDGCQMDPDIGRRPGESGPRDSGGRGVRAPC